MEDDREIMRILEEIRNELSLLTVKMKAAAQNRFFDDFLTTEQRRQIYRAFNGEKDIAQIAEEVGCALRSVQAFVKELEDKDLIEIRRDGKKRMPCKATEKIALYYALQDLHKEGSATE